MLRAVVVALLLALAASAPAGAHGPAQETHGDPRAALPDSLVTAPVAAAEAGSLEPATPALAATELPETWCGTERATDETANARFPSTAPQLKLLYVYAADQPNRFDQFDDRLQANVSLLNRFLATQSGGRKALRWDMGTSCGAEYVDIQALQLPRTRAEYVPNGAPSFDLVQADVKAAVAAAQPGPRNWVVYADGFRGTNGVAGTGSMYLTDDANGGFHNGGRLVNVTFGPSTPPANAYAWPSVMLHEIAHNLGAVQDPAPHSTKAGHCNDRYDVMCYADGGPASAPAYPCPRISGVVDETFDCGGDDYFNPSPPIDGYLDRAWNVYRSAYLGPCTSELSSSCGVAADGTAPVDTTPVRNATTWSNQPYTVQLSGSDSESAVDGFAWKVDDGPVHTTSTATVDGYGELLHTRVRDAAGNWSRWRSDSVMVDADRVVATASCPAGWQAGPVDCTVTADAGSRAIASLAWQLDGGAWQDVAPGAAVRVSAHGTHAVNVRATDTAGRVGTSTATVRIDTTAPVMTFTCTDGWSSTAAACRLVADDPESGVADRRWRFDGGSEQTASRSWTVPLREGTFTVEGRAVNAVGRSTAWSSDTVRMDLTKPVVAVDCPSTARADTTRCTITASDARSGLAGLTWRLDDGPATPVAPGAAVSIPADGRHTVTATATDRVGHERTTSTEVGPEGTEPEVPLAPVHEADPQPFPDASPGDDAGAGPLSPPAVLEKDPARTVLRDARRRTVATAVLRRSGARVTAVVTPRRLAGRWRVRVCAGARCVTKRLRSRRAVKVALPRGTSTATVALERRSGGRFRRVARTRVATTTK